jgi:transcription elongation factor Elf1
MGPKIPLGQTVGKPKAYVTIYRKGYFEYWKCPFCGRIIDSAQAVLHAKMCALAHCKDSQDVYAQKDVKEAIADAAARQRAYERKKKETQHR